MSGYLPQALDFFPKTRRGHGTTHPFPRFNRKGTPVVQTRAACECVNSACVRLRRGGKGGEAHDDQQANVLEWKDERGIPEGQEL